MSEGDDLEVLRAACAWAGAGDAFALATVVRTWGSAPRPPGSWAAIREDGRLVGSVSGGCVEEDLIRRVRGRSPALDRTGGLWSSNVSRGV